MTTETPSKLEQELNKHREFLSVPMEPAQSNTYQMPPPQDCIPLSDIAKYHGPNTNQYR